MSASKRQAERPEVGELKGDRLSAADEPQDEVSGVLISLSARVVNREGAQVGRLNEVVVEIETEEIVGFLVVTDELAPREVYIDIGQLAELEPTQLTLDLSDEEFVALPDAREHLFVAPDQDPEVEIERAEASADPAAIPDPDERPQPSSIPGVALTPNLLIPLAVERGVIGEGQVALRDGMRIRTEEGDGLGQIDGVIVDDEVRLIALTLLGEEGEAILFSAIDTIDEDANELIIAIGDEDDPEDGHVHA